MVVYIVASIAYVHQIVYRFPSAGHKFKVYHQRVSTRQYANILICNLSAHINLFKDITDKVEHCIENIYTDFQQAFAIWDWNRRKFSGDSFQKKTLYHIETEQMQKNYHKNILDV